MTCGLESFKQDKKNKNANTPSSNVIIRDGVIPTRQWATFKEH
jgi:hypothetical protein